MIGPAKSCLQRRRQQDAHVGRSAIHHGDIRKFVHIQTRGDKFTRAGPHRSFRRGVEHAIAIYERDDAVEITLDDDQVIPTISIKVDDLDRTRSTWDIDPLSDRGNEPLPGASVNFEDARISLHANQIRETKMR